MKTTELHNRTLAVLEDVGRVLSSINRLDPQSFEELNAQAVVRLIDAQSALTDAARLIDQPMLDRAIERAKTHA
jgi:hypothetical protein